MHTLLLLDDDKEVLDVMMPDMNGVDACEEFRKNDEEMVLSHQEIVLNISSTGKRIL